MNLNTGYNETGESFEDVEVLLERLNTEFTTKLLPVTIFVGIEAVVGFIGNFLIIFVFAFYYNACNYRTFNICLGLIDFTCTLTTMPGEIITQHFWYNYPFPNICKTKDFFNIFTVCAETFCLLVIAIDRFRKVCRPLQWQITQTVAVRLCFVVLFLAAAIASPVCVFWGMRSYEKVYKNTTITVTLCEKDAKYENTAYPFGYEAVVGGIVFLVLVPMLLLNILVARQLTSDKRRGMLASSKSPRPLPIISATEKSTASVGFTESSKDSNTCQLSADSANNSKKGPTDFNNGKTDANEKEKDDEDQSSTKCQLRRPGSTKKSVVSKTGKKKANVTRQQSETRSNRVRRKALIMFILTTTFILTTVLYFTLISILGSAGNVVNGLSDNGKALFFFFLRFYFIQHIINPILYAIMDPQVRNGLAAMLRKLPCRQST